MTHQQITPTSSNPPDAATPVPKLSYSPQEAAIAIGCHRNTIYAMVKRKELRSVRVGRVIRIPKEAVTEFLNGVRA